MSNLGSEVIKVGILHAMIERLRSDLTQTEKELDALTYKLVGDGVPATFKEHITAAALLVGENGANIAHSLPRPARHHHIIHVLAGHGFDAGQLSVQGFLTSRGRYVGREEAMLIATAAGQLKGRPVHPRKLHSEDLW